MLTHGSVYTGIAGFDYGLWLAGIDTLWQIEKERFCREVNAKHKDEYWPNARLFGNVRECGHGRKHELDAVDIVTIGSPCQGFSVAGKCKGFEDKRSRRFYEGVRIVRELRPIAVLIENVSRILDIEGDRVLAEVEGADYACWPLVLRAHTLGATHERKRAFILCLRADVRVHEHTAAGVPGGHPVAERALAEANERWGRRRDELAAVLGGAGPDAYARIRRACHGIPRWVDRLDAVGNSVVPQISMLFGIFIQSLAKQMEEK